MLSHWFLLAAVVGLLATGPHTTNALLIRPNIGATAVDAAAALAVPSRTRTVELKGAVRIGGGAASSVRLTFHQNQGRQREWRARIKSDGTYRITLKGGDTDVICARIERNRPLNSIANCRHFSAGVHRLDFDLPPGAHSTHRDHFVRAIVITRSTAS